VAGFISHSRRPNTAAPLGYIGRRCARGLGGRYLPRPSLLLQAPLSSPLRARSWSSFCEITVSQNRTTACHNHSLRNIAATIAGSERSCPTAATRSRRSCSHARHSSSVCGAVSSGAPQWWHSAVRSRPIQRRKSPKQPCPVNTCVVRYGIPCPALPSLSGEAG